MTFLPKLESNYFPLRVALGGYDLGSKERWYVRTAIQEWNWADPERKRYLPALMELVGNLQDVTVHFVEELDDILLVGGLPMILKDNSFGACVTDTETGACDVYIDRNMHKQLGPGWEVPVILHELGHAGGLRHTDTVLPNGIMQASLIGHGWLEGDGESAASAFRIVTQKEREFLRDMRADSVVGVDSLEGN